jgi:hypothetical protein
MPPKTRSPPVDGKNSLPSFELLLSPDLRLICRKDCLRPPFPTGTVGFGMLARERLVQLNFGRKRLGTCSGSPPKAYKAACMATI